MPDTSRKVDLSTTSCESSVLRLFVRGDAYSPPSSISSESLLASRVLAFARQLRNSLITEIGRRGKYILFKLESGHVLATHLRMTGKFVSLTTDQSLPPYAHVVFYLDDERRLVFCDMRQFGRMRIFTQPPKELTSLAPEPLSEEFTEEYLIEPFHDLAVIETVAVRPDTCSGSRKYLRSRSALSRRC